MTLPLFRYCLAPDLHSVLLSSDYEKKEHTQNYDEIIARSKYGDICRFSLIWQKIEILLDSSVIL